MMRGNVIPWIVLAACGATGCAGAGPQPRPGLAPADRVAAGPVHRPRDRFNFGASDVDIGIDRALAPIAEGVSRGLQRRLEAGEPLTPEFARLVRVWSQRAYAHRFGADTSAATLLAAADRYRQAAADAYRLAHPASDGDAKSPEALITESALGAAEAELVIAQVEARVVNMDDLDDLPPPTVRAQPVIARDLWDSIRRRVEAGEPLTPEFLELSCDASLELMTWEAAGPRQREASQRAADAHLERVEALMNRLDSAHLPGASRQTDVLRYHLAQAKGMAARWVRTGDQSAAMLDAARRHVADLWQRKDAGEPPTPQFVEAMCAWSERLMWAEQMSQDEPAMRDAASRHRRRMGDLHAELKKRLDEGRDVTRTQISQAEYFLRKAEMGPRQPRGFAGGTFRGHGPDPVELARVWR